MTHPLNILLRSLKQPRHAIDYTSQMRKLSKFQLDNTHKIHGFFIHCNDYNCTIKLKIPDYILI